MLDKYAKYYYQNHNMILMTLAIYWVYDMCLSFYLYCFWLQEHLKDGGIR